MRGNFEVIPYCSSKFSDKNMNTLSRIENSFIEAINTKFYLPEYLVIFLDSDLINYLDFKRSNLASLFSLWIEYLCQVVAETFQHRFQLLSPKAKRDPTQVYWVEPVGHNNFNYADQQAREIFTQCLEASCKVHGNMHVLKIREFWDKSDDNYVINNRFTKLGVSAYWRSLDVSFKFNMKKREDFMIRQKFRTLKAKSDEKGQGQSMRAVREDIYSRTTGEDQDEMLQFFARCHTPDRFHWNNPGRGNGPRFFLPRLKTKRF